MPLIETASTTFLAAPGTSGLTVGVGAGSTVYWGKGDSGVAVTAAGEDRCALTLTPAASGAAHYVKHG